jgi:hypothetical protein
MIGSRVGDWPQAMRRKYNFSKGVRGKFYRPGARLPIPVSLEPIVQRSPNASRQTAPG